MENTRLKNILAIVIVFSFMVPIVSFAAVKRKSDSEFGNLLKSVSGMGEKEIESTQKDLAKQKADAQKIRDAAKPVRDTAKQEFQAAQDLVGVTSDGTKYYRSVDSDGNRGVTIEDSTNFNIDTYNEKNQVLKNKRGAYESAERNYRRSDNEYNNINTRANAFDNSVEGFYRQIGTNSGSLLNQTSLRKGKNGLL